MAIIYVDSTAAGTDDGTSWTDALPTLQLALTDATYAWTDGDEIWVAHDHTEGTASVTLTATNDSIANRIPIYRVNSGTDVYSPTTGSDTKQYDLSTSGADLVLSFDGSIHGMYLSAEDTMTLSGTATSISFKDCKFAITQAALNFTLGSANSDGSNMLTNCTFHHTHTSGGYTYLYGNIEFNACVFIGYANGNGLLGNAHSGRGSNGVFRGCDFSGLSSSTTLRIVDSSSFSDNANCQWHFIACKFKAAQVIQNDGFQNDHQCIYLHNCDLGGGDTFETARYGFRGDVQTDTTVYFGGTDAYVDADGDTPMSHQMIPASNVDIASPLTSLDMFARVDTTGSKTFTVECVEEFTAALTKRECWLEVFYLGTAAGADTLWHMDDDREIVASSYTTFTDTEDSANWTGEPGTNNTIQVTASGTIGQTGVFMCRLHLAKYESAKTFYYNPVVTVT